MNRDTKRILTSALDLPAAEGVTPGGHPDESARAAPPSSRYDARDFPTQPGGLPAAPLVRDRASLVMLTGVDAGRVFVLDAEVTTALGRGSDATCTLDDPGVSRHHATIRFVDGQWIFEDLGSTNGSFVAGLPTRGASAVLRPGARIQLGPEVVLRFSVTDAAEAELQARLFESSTRDGLTQLYNRRYFSERFAAEAAYALRHRTPLALLLLDIDRFKGVNDRYGHLAGDAVLCEVAEEILRVVRAEDVVARFGGEELVVLARATSRDSGARLAERIRASIGHLRVTAPGAPEPIGVTVSVGVADLAEIPQGGGEHELLALADARLLLAKAAGRNLVVAEDS
ncbi:MAG TPA: GGDEF domain-containing protein [Polyangiaceae bacterium]|jgi:diguanylate cyclase (GGDEF)-like protein|nr:GGDEF domain-containing protein [Polyangiaceae bacterium]